MKFILNKAYGGWGLYDERFVEWCKKNAPEFLIKDEEDGETYFNYNLMDNDTFYIRTHPKMIKFVESGASKQTGSSALVVVKVPDDVSPDKYYVDDYDGIETLHENHRQW